MARLLIFTVTFLTLLVVSPPEAGAAAERTAFKDVQAIRKTFESYKEALLKREGQASASLVNGATLDYYKRMQELALRGKEPDVRQLPIGEKLIVLRMRHQIPVQDLQMMNPQALFAHGVTQGWIDSGSVQAVSLGKIAVTGERASAETLLGKKPTPLKFAFTRDGEEWKFDLAALMPLVEQEFKKLAKESGMGEDEFLIQVLELVSGKKVAKEIWQPLVSGSDGVKE
jgi:hypothetical protein